MRRLGSNLEVVSRFHLGSTSRESQLSPTTANSRNIQGRSAKCKEIESPKELVNRFVGSVSTATRDDSFSRPQSLPATLLSGSNQDSQRGDECDSLQLACMVLLVAGWG